MRNSEESAFACPDNGTEYTTTWQGQKGLTKREYFAGVAISAVTAETVDTVPLNLWNWFKQLLVILLHLTFIEVKYKDVAGAHEAAAKRAISIADELLKQLDETNKH